MNRAGVTLIELMVSLTIAALVLSVGYGAFANALDRRDGAFAAVEATADAATIRTTLLTWLKGARVPPEASRPVFRGSDGVDGMHPDDELLFLTGGITPLGPGLATIRLWIDGDPDTPASGLMAEVTRWLGTDRTTLNLVPGAEGLDIRYRSAVLSGRNWHDSWVSSSVMPQGLELRVTAPDSVRLHGLLAHPILVAFEGGR